MANGSPDYWYVYARTLVNLLETLHGDLYDSSESKTRLELAIDQLALTVAALGDVITALSTEIGDPLQAFLALTVTTWETSVNACEQIVSAWGNRSGCRIKSKSSNINYVKIYEAGSCGGAVTYTLNPGEEVVTHYTNVIYALNYVSEQDLIITEW